MLLVQRANVERYPPVLHQSRMLQGVSHVRILDRVSQSDADLTRGAGDMDRIRVHIQTRRDGSVALLGRLFEAITFTRALNRELGRKPDVAIAYDPDAASLLLRRRASPLLKRIVHFHEVLELGTTGRTTRLSIAYLLKHLNRADLVIVPDSERAKLVASEARLRADPMVVMNCPPLLPVIPESRLLPELQRRGLHASSIIHYQGAVGREHHLDDVIRSMVYWPDESIFVIVGGGVSTYRERLRELASSVGVGSRVQFIDQVPYGEVLSYAVGATIGLTLLEPTIKNWKYSAGASNKRFEYAALGIAQVTNDGPGMDEVFGRTKIASLLPTVEPEAIGREIARLLSNPAETAAMGERARAAHLSTNNYEAQFAPVMHIIERWLDDAS